MEKNMERKVSGYYGTGEELLVPITGKSIETYREA